MTNEEIHNALMRPFPVDRLHWRAGPTKKDGTGCIALAYIDSRDVMRRLDEVVGPAGWQSKMVPVGNGRLACELSVKYGEEWITKTDGAGETDVEGAKGVFSDALKRAAVLHGIGRYLYALPNEWVDMDPRTKKIVRPPSVPSWATPEGFDAIQAKRVAPVEVVKEESHLAPSVQHQAQERVEKAKGKKFRNASDAALFCDASLSILEARETVGDINAFLKEHREEIEEMQQYYPEACEEFKRQVNDIRNKLEEA
jgi:hypothetical protein